MIKAQFPEIQQYNVLDLGGSIHFWQEVGDVLKPKSVTIMNIAADHQSVGDDASHDHINSIVLYDGKNIPYGDNEIDLLICNSVMEHVPKDERLALVNEIERVSKRYVVQTPAKSFVVEPHFVMPVVHWIPRPLGRVMVNLSPLAIFNGPRYAKAMFDEVNLLNHREITSLFKQRRIVREMSLGMTKSYMVFKD
ncbi:hypothetical protein GCM10010833_07750 [Blastomonas aquatica]|uniref:Methyltransferase type 11 domain-containing protein n=1 Tax=Blastomonas aquatica TaxID=1510276 RepID=A0ABQ1IY61_9SPHN|nr:hypothetical protein GCM10010833_07750 [Blastomonas aquatica]